MTQVLLIPVKSNHEKLQKIVEIATHYFDKNEKITFLVENEMSASYIDKLLWSSPKESFLPHGGELISILQVLPTETQTIFNLTSEPLTDIERGTIYEFDDQTSEHKQQAFKTRYSAYKAKRFSIALQ
ncbi:MAG: DNA polymerase III subunit chi [Chlamydiia bacterium]|nr:DNA polymerase III subunit chi [Chlamydiia bacterium]